MMLSDTQPAAPPDSAVIATAARAWLEWYLLAGVGDCIEAAGTDRTVKAASSASLPSSSPLPLSPPTSPAQPALLTGAAQPAPARRRAEPLGGKAAGARALAQSCADLASLEQALETFDGCALRATATRLCFADGNPASPLMLVGEAPGAEEDRQGKPFVGPSGQLLDRILAAVGLDRRQLWITNIVFWRPPGNRPPTSTEIAVCQPFLERQIELIQPRLILFLGKTAAAALLDLTDGVSRLRGRRFTYQPPSGGNAIPAFVTFHPAYLLRQPLQKRFVWRDMLAVKHELEVLGVASPSPSTTSTTH